MPGTVMRTRPRVSRTCSDGVNSDIVLDLVPPGAGSQTPTVARQHFLAVREHSYPWHRLRAGVTFHEASAALASSVAAIADQSRANAMRASSARSTNGWPLTSTMALWIVPPTNAQGLSPG